MKRVTEPSIRLARILCNYHYTPPEVPRVKNGTLIKKEKVQGKLVVFRSPAYERRSYKRKRQSGVSTVTAREFGPLEGSAKLRAIVAVTFTFPIRGITI